MRFEFEWHISDLTPEGFYYIHERLCGTDLMRIYGPVPSYKIAEAFVKSRRQFVHRVVVTRTQAVQIFEPRPGLALLAKAQAEKAKRQEESDDDD